MTVNEAAVLARVNVFSIPHCGMCSLYNMGECVLYTTWVNMGECVLYTPLWNVFSL
jgi:hypothetical protein